MLKNAQKELASLEQQYWQALKDNDLAAVLRLTDDPCIVAGPQGVAQLTNQQMAAMMQTATYSLTDFTLKDLTVQIPREDVAIVAYKVKVDMTVEGKGVSLEAADASTWVRRGEGWRCALHTEALLGDPFGRDTKPS
jgi:ketosteroid isomerase-like protein